MRIDATGFDDYADGDRPALYASFGEGNTDSLEIFLQYVDAPSDIEVALGYFKVRDLQQILAAAIKHYENGTTE